MPTFLECQRCAACCRWPGFVQVNEAEITALAAQLKIPETVFIARFTRLRPDRQGLALTDKENGECVFLQEGGCSVQAAKPQQCRDFPNLWKNPGMEAQCQAIAREVSAKDYIALVAKATGRPQEHIRSSR